MKTTSQAIAALLCAVALFAVGTVDAASLNYGDYSDMDNGTVVFEDVTEDNGETETYYGDAANLPTATGNTLRFDLQNFQSQSQNGADLLDSQMSMMITANPGTSISTVRIDEFGDYTLGGLPTFNAQASVGGSYFLTILEVDNAPVFVQVQTDSLDVTDGGMYTRPTDDGTAQVWIGDASFDVDAILAANNITGEATKVALTFDNTLQTAADEFSNAFIKKKGLSVTVGGEGTPVIPEPASASLALLALAGVAIRRRS